MNFTGWSNILELCVTVQNVLERILYLSTGGGQSPAGARNMMTPAISRRGFSVEVVYFL